MSQDLTKEELLVLISELLNQSAEEIDADVRIVNNFIDKVGFQSLFAALLMDDADMEDYVVRALNKIFTSKFGASILANQEVKPFLEQGISSDSQKLRSLSLRQVENAMKHNEDASFLTDPELFSNILQALMDDSPGIVKQITDIFTRAAAKSDQFVILFWSDATLDTLKYFTEHDSTVYLRIHSLCNSIGKVSDHSFRLYIKSEMLNDVVEKMHQTDDVLLQITLFETVGEIGSSASGLRYLSRVSILETLANVIMDAKSKSLMFVCSGGLQLFDRLMESSKKFGDCDWWVKNSDKMIDLMEAFIVSDDPPSKMACIVMISTACTVPEGFQLMMKKGLAIQVPHGCRSYNEETKLTSLHALSAILQPTRDGGEAELKYQHEMASSISPQGSLADALETLFVDVKRPFDEVSYAAMKLISVISVHSWGLEAVLECGGLVEHIQNRNTSRTKTASEWRYKIVQNLARNEKLNAAEVARRFPGVKERLENYLALGPFVGGNPGITL